MFHKELHDYLVQQMIRKLELRALEASWEAEPVIHRGKLESDTEISEDRGGHA